MSLYSDAVLALSPNSYWRFASGALTDSGSAAITLSATGAPTSVASIIPSEGGVSGNAYQLNGSSMYLQAGDNYDMSGEVNWTIAFWVKPISAATFARIIEKRDTGGANPGYLFYTGGTAQQSQFDVDFGVTVEGLGTASVFPDQVVRFIVLTWVDSGSVYRMYVDGVDFDDKIGGAWTVPPGFPASTSPFTIGASSDGAFFYAGIVDDVAVWEGTALTGPQILSLFNVGNAAPAGSFQPRPSMTSRGVGW